METPGSDDIRDRPFLAHADILQLNFIRSPGKYVFRRHYRAGLRSHLMEVLDPEDVTRESRGVLADGLYLFPRAVPLKMLRIFRRRFNGLTEAREEIRRVKIVEASLAPDHIARPSEFLVDYSGPEKWEILLAGLQEYVAGEVLEPWGDLGKGLLSGLLDRMRTNHGPDPTREREHWVEEVRTRAGGFVSRVRHLIVEHRLIPDLAGVGNLLLTKTGDIKLVDINNISDVSPGPSVALDDRGYPVCDKSMAVLFHLEEKLTSRSPRRDDPVYGPFLDPRRIQKVKALEKRFHLSTGPSSPCPGQCDHDP
ncbi:MAG: hypothetical protein K9N21_14245 [Deltaproteobacteria bacterium]|nr:hypothetical protein [Deltaproteobacteria bacterium]